MRFVNLMENWKFSHKGAHANPLYVDRNGRIIVFTLKGGQSIREHNAPSSQFYAFVLSGQGVFAGGDNVEQTFGPNTLLIFEPGENHFIRALDELVFVGFLHGAPGAQE